MELNPKTVRLAELLHDAIKNQEDIARLKRIDLVADLAGENPMVVLDKDLILRVLDNLLFNAVKFSPSGSLVSLKLDRPAADDALRIQVIDQGPGIPAEYRQRIFEEYEIVRANLNDVPQVGLGLSFCKQVLDAHGGTISVEDNDPQGSIFTIHLLCGGKQTAMTIDCTGRVTADERP